MNRLLMRNKTPCHTYRLNYFLFEMFDYIDSCFIQKITYFSVDFLTLPLVSFDSLTSLSDIVFFIIILLNFNASLKSFVILENQCFTFPVQENTVNI